ncbi:MAG: UDP-N-acetylmuramoyl-L-alanyl-D-glutamate--2,6-diaminopimelate ligase [Actinobacteria bacterium]|nr:MAG: UDP-N-acetylmuramoyl-L-alanyl-D-glutamate--2,6-diaminopimelate ligase [Actinomycetota bacterium]
MQLERLIAALAPTDVVGGGALEIRELAYDAREVPRDSLFFCVPGARTDGHDLAAQAVASGAVALVVERRLPLGVRQLVVPSVRQAMPLAAVEFFGDPTAELSVAAITGTNGKTTTAYLLWSILAAAGESPGLLTNIERRVGGEVREVGLNTPESIDLQRLFREMVSAGDRACVIEATSMASVKGRLVGTRFAVLVFTNLTQDHLDFHGSMEAYFDSKRRLFAQAERAVINVGDEFGARLAAELPGSITFSSLDDLPGVELKLQGDFNRENALAAAAAAHALGVADDSIKQGIEAVERVPGRFDRVEEGQPFTVLVDYAHTPSALETALGAARQLTGGRVICVFGAGGDRDRAKRPLMGRVVNELADVVLVTSDNPRSEDPAEIAAEVVGALQLDVELDRRRAIERALEAAREGDVVVIAGKGHEQGQEVRSRRLPFDDREVARETLRRLRAPA